MAGHFAADGSLQVNDGAPAVGRAAITATAQSFMTAFPDLKVLLMSCARTGTNGTFTTGRWWGQTAAQAAAWGRVRISGYEEWTISADGLIARSLGHFDAAEYARQLRGRRGVRGVA